MQQRHETRLVGPEAGRVDAIDPVGFIGPGHAAIQPIDPAADVGDGLRFRQLPPLFDQDALDTLAFADVLDDAIHVQGLACGSIPVDFAPAEQPVFGAVGPDDAVFPLIVAIAGNGGPHRLADRFPVVGVQAVQGASIIDLCAGGPAEQPAGLLAPVYGVRRHVPLPDAVAVPSAAPG